MTGTKLALLITGGAIATGLLIKAARAASKPGTAPPVGPGGEEPDYGDLPKPPDPSELEDDQ